MKKIVLALFAIFVSTMLAERAATPSKADALSQGVKQVTITEAKQLFDSGAIFLDARKAIDMARGKIKGSLKASYKDKGGNKNKIINWDKSKDSYVKEYFPANKNTKIVTYCNGPKCWKSYKLAVVLVKDHGYTNINWLRDGFPAWKDAGNPTD